MNSYFLIKLSLGEGQNGTKCALERQIDKALDNIDHRILLRKSVNVDASPTVVKWFESYLSGRNQEVRIGFSLSSQRPVIHGVPQGAVYLYK